MRHMFSQKIRAIFTIAMAAMLLSSCASFREFMGFDTEAQLKFNISSAVNPDTNGRPSPIVINLLFLKDNRQFEQEDLISLLSNASERLGKDVIDTVRLKEFIPGEERTETFKLSNDTAYIGILAEYVQYQDAEAKLILPIEAHTTNKYFVNINKLSMSEKH